MADGLGIITENDAGTSWVDLVPDKVSTGYQAQNTNIEANRNGIDLSYVYYDSGADEIVIDPSGPIDDNGLPFSVDSEITFANPGAGTWYLRVIPGSTSLLRSIDIVSTQGTWDGSKNGLYDGNPYRILNWVIEGGSGEATVSKLLPFSLNVIDGLQTDNVILKTNVIEIGDWNMDTTAAGSFTATVAHGLGSDFAKIRSLEVIIRNDANTQLWKFNSFSLASGDLNDQFTYADSTNINLRQAVTTGYQNVNFDSTSYNRGWITIKYEV